MMKGRLLAILVILVFAFSTDTSARNLFTDASLEDSRKPVSAPGGSHMRAFVNPDTGEVLTYEQWQSFDFEDQREEHPRHDSATDAEEVAERTIEERTITLPDGRQVTVVKAPDWMKVHTRVRFDDKGKAYLTCD